MKEHNKEEIHIILLTRPCAKDKEGHFKIICYILHDLLVTVSSS